MEYGALGFFLSCLASCRARGGGSGVYSVGSVQLCPQQTLDKDLVSQSLTSRNRSQ